MEDSIRFSAAVLEASRVLYYRQKSGDGSDEAVIGLVHAIGFRVADAGNGQVVVELVGDPGEDEISSTVKQFLCKTHQGTGGNLPRDEGGHRIFTLLVPKPGYAVSSSDDPVVRVENGIFNCAYQALLRARYKVCAQACEA